MEQHYPERTFKIKILNAPGWFNWIAWPIVTKLANAATLSKGKYSKANAVPQNVAGYYRSSNFYSCNPLLLSFIESHLSNKPKQVYTKKKSNS